MSFARGTTPTLSIKFSAEKYPSLNLTEATNVIVTISSGTKRLSKKKDDLEVSEKQIDVFLSQQETLNFGSDAKIQANWLTTNGKRAATKIIDMQIGAQLYEKVIEDA